jgi:hypothetical protein
VRRQPGGPIDDEMGQAARTEDLIGYRRAPARIENVSLEEE